MLAVAIITCQVGGLDGFYLMEWPGPTPAPAKLEEELGRDREVEWVERQQSKSRRRPSTEL